MANLPNPQRPTRYLVTVDGRGPRARARIWDTAEPFVLGHPVRWVLERTEQGVRVRDVGGKFGEIRESAVRTLTSSELETGGTIPLSSLQLRIEPVRAVAPAYRAPTPADSKENVSEIDVYECLNHCIMSHSRVSATPSEGTLTSFEASGEVGRGKLFTLTGTASNARISIHADGLVMENGSRKELKSGETIELTTAQLSDHSITFGSRTWHFQASAALRTLESEAAKAPASLMAQLRQWVAELDEEGRWFFRSIQYAFAAFMVLIIALHVWPEPDPAELAEEIIPPQFAKVVMNRVERKDPGPKRETATQAKDTAVAKAFRAQAVQNSISNLLKGGVSNLLKQSSLVNAADSSKARSMLSAAGKPSRDLASVADRAKARDVAVNTMGGKTDDGVGYSEGKSAGLTGQGGAFLALETDESTVQEGLSKDEVGKVIHAHMAEVRYCYESALLRNPDVEGRLVVDFVIAGSGRVNSTAVKETTVKDARLDDCVLRRLKTWKFPQPKGGSKVAVSYPFVFKVLGD